MIVKVVIVDGENTTDVTLQVDPSGPSKGDNGNLTVISEDPLDLALGVFLRGLQGAGFPVVNLAVELDDDSLLWAK